MLGLYVPVRPQVPPLQGRVPMAGYAARHGGRRHGAGLSPAPPPRLVVHRPRAVGRWAGAAGTPRGSVD
eukprot:12417049-Alexandrium_andersonii.AAC.1